MSPLVLGERSLVGILATVQWRQLEQCITQPRNIFLDPTDLWCWSSEDGAIQCMEIQEAMHISTSDQEDLFSQASLQDLQSENAEGLQLCVIHIWFVLVDNELENGSNSTTGKILQVGCTQGPIKPIGSVSHNHKQSEILSHQQHPLDLR